MTAKSIADVVLLIVKLIADAVGADDSEVRAELASRCVSTDTSAEDLLAEIQIVLPKELGDADQKMIQEFGQRHPQDPRANLKW